MKSINMYKITYVPFDKTSGLRGIEIYVVAESKEAAENVIISLDCSDELAINFNASVGITKILEGFKDET